MNLPPDFDLSKAPKDRSNFPMAGLLLDIQPHRWVDISQDAQDETVEVGRLQADIVDLFGEVAAQQHRYVTDMQDVLVEEPAPPTPEQPTPEAEAIPSLGSPTLYQALASVLAGHDAFAEMKASEFNQIVTDVVEAVSS